MKPTTKFQASIVASLCAIALQTHDSNAVTVLTFDDVSPISPFNSTSFDDYAVLGITFSPNANIWVPGTHPSVLTNPNGASYSVPNGLQFGMSGGDLGSIYFATAADSFSIWALSGHGPNVLSSGMYIRAFNAANAQIGEAIPNPSLQFDLVSISVPGITRIDLFSPTANKDF